MPDSILSATLLGANDLIKSLKSADSFAKQELAKALNRAANEARQIASKKAPHLHGKLRDSLHTENATPENLVAKVGTNVVYARAQEYGTQDMVIHSHSKTGKQFTYKGNIKPKFYMRDAKAEVKPKLTNYLREAARRIVTHIATGS